jgi:hypothetical protein
MASYKRIEEKRADDGSLLILYKDRHDGSWFVGRPGDNTLDPIPIGAFCSAAAARTWADVHFSGGAWSSAARA